jgi:aminopeptidase N
VKPVLSSVLSVRDAFFASLKDENLRKKESWVADALSYLHHPLRHNTSIRYLKESLQMLQDIQSTGDIFFPGAWLSATFGSYQSNKAAGIVHDFLKANPGYNIRLKAKILQAADPLFRAQKIMEK